LGLYAANEENFSEEDLVSLERNIDSLLSAVNRKRKIVSTEMKNKEPANKNIQKQTDLDFLRQRESKSSIILDPL